MGLVGSLIVADLNWAGSQDTRLAGVFVSENLAACQVLVEGTFPDYLRAAEVASQVLRSWFDIRVD